MGKDEGFGSGLQPHPGPGPGSGKQNLFLSSFQNFISQKVKKMRGRGETSRERKATESVPLPRTDSCSGQKRLLLVALPVL